MRNWEGYWESYEDPNWGKTSKLRYQQDLISSVPYWRQNGFLSQLHEIASQCPLSKNQMKTVEELNQIYPLLGTGEDTKSRISLALWRAGVKDFQSSWKTRILGRLGDIEIVNLKSFFLSDIRLENACDILLTTAGPNSYIDFSRFVTNMSLDKDTSHYTTEYETFVRAFLNLFSSDSEFEEGLLGFKENPSPIYFRGCYPTTKYSFSCETDFVIHTKEKDICIYLNTPMEITWDPKWESFFINDVRIPASLPFDERDERLAIATEIIALNKHSVTLNQEKLEKSFSSFNNKLTPNLNSDTIKQENNTMTYPTDDNYRTSEDSESPKSTLKDVAKNVGGAIAEGAKEGAKLAAASEMSHLVSNLLKDVVVKFGVPKDILDTEVGETVLLIFGPILIMFLVEMFGDQIPAADILKAASEKALTAVSFEKISGLFEEFMPQIMDLVSKSKEIVDPVGALGATKPSPVDRIQSKTVNATS